MIFLQCSSLWVGHSGALGELYLVRLKQWIPLEGYEQGQQKGWNWGCCGGQDFPPPTPGNESMDVPILLFSPFCSCGNQLRWKSPPASCLGFPRFKKLRFPCCRRRVQRRGKKGRQRHPWKAKGAGVQGVGGCRDPRDTTTTCS